MPRLVNNIWSAAALTKVTGNSELIYWCFACSAGDSIRRDVEADIGRTSTGHKLVNSDIQGSSVCLDDDTGQARSCQTLNLGAGGVHQESLPAVEKNQIHPDMDWRKGRRSSMVYHHAMIQQEQISVKRSEC